MFDRFLQIIIILEIYGLKNIVEILFGSLYKVSTVKRYTVSYGTTLQTNSYYTLKLDLVLQELSLHQCWDTSYFFLSGCSWDKLLASVKKYVCCIYMENAVVSTSPTWWWNNRLFHQFLEFSGNVKSHLGFLRVYNGFSFRR